MERIEFETKSDRELLILVAQKTNDIVKHLTTLNDSVAKNSRDIAGIKAQQGGIFISDSKPRRQVLKDNWQKVTGLGALLAVVLYELGRLCSWWP